MRSRSGSCLSLRSWMGRLLVGACLLTCSLARGEGRIELPPNKLADVKQSFDQFMEKSRSIRPEVDKLITVHLSAKPALLLAGEKVTIALKARAAKRPNAALEIYPRYLETGMKQKEEILLKWKKTGREEGQDVYEATLKYRPQVKGNFLVHWKNDIGGDIPEFWRYFAVIDSSYAVCGLESTNGGPVHGPAPVCHALHLPFKYWVQPSLFRDGWTAEMWAEFSRASRQFGDTPSFMIWCSNGQYMPYNPAVKPDISGWQVVFLKEPPEVQQLILERYKKDVWPILGFDGPLENVHTYGIGNTSIPMARKLGYKYVGSLCASQNWRDDTFLINHSGMPDRPFFIAKEDFRKTGDGGPSGMVGLQQCHRHPSQTSDYGCLYSLEPCVPFHPSFGGSGRKVIDAVAFSQFQDFFEAMLQNRLSQNVPYFFSVGLEFGGEFAGTEEANTYFLKQAVRTAAEVPLVFAAGDDIGDFYRRHYKKTPETTCYLPDIFTGDQYDGKPPVYPDIIEMESWQLKALLRKPEILPYNQYDYLTSWKGYPDWGNEGIPRQASGYTYPDTDDRFRQTPRMLDTRRFTVSREDQEEKEYTEITLKLESTVAQKNLALALWEIPRAWQAGAGWFKSSGACRFVPVRAPFSGDLSGILIAQVKPGTNVFKLKVRSASRKPVGTALSLNEGRIQGRLYSHDGQSMAYLCVLGKSPEKLTLQVPQGRDVRLYAAPEGKEVRAQNGKNTFELAGASWLRVTGLSLEEFASPK